MPIWKALLVDGESKVINHLIHGEYELNNTSWSKLQKKYIVSRNKIKTGGSCLSQIFWEHENLSGLSIIRLIQLL